MRSDRILFALALAFAAGLAAGFALGRFGELWPLAGGLSALVLALGVAYDRCGFGLLALSLAALSLALSYEAGRREVLRSAELRGGRFDAELKVERVSPSSFAATVRGVRLRVVFGQGRGVRPLAGEIWRVSGFLERKDSGDHAVRRVWATGRAARLERVEERGSLAEAGERLRADFSRRIGIGLGHSPEAAAILRAIVLGERGGVPRELKDVFAGAGTTHVFAISGLHVGVVAAMIFYLMVLAGFPVRWTALAVVPAAWAYVFMIGAPPSAVRAAGMTTVVVMAPICYRRGDLLTAWSLVFLLTHCVDPGLLVDVGSLLSFTVMLAIALWCRAFRRGVTFAAWAAGVPIVAHVFGQFTMAGLLANLVLLPTASVAVGTGVLGVAASYLSETLAAHCNNLAALVVKVMVAVSGAAAGLPGGSFAVASWSFRRCAAWYALLIMSLWLFVRVRDRRRRTL